MIRTRAGRSVPRPTLLLGVLAVLLVAACTDAFAPTSAPTTGGASLKPTLTGASGSPAPTASVAATSTPTITPEVTSPPPSETAGASPAGTACSGNDNNRVFFAKAAATMTWAVYCAVLPAGWFFTGKYSVANGGVLEGSYNGPGDARIGLGEGNVCDQAGTDINVCAPRDAVIGPAPFGDRTGELGRLSNALVLDVDRGANPSWRVTGLGLSEVDFRAICAAMLRVPAGS